MHTRRVTWVVISLALLSTLSWAALVGRSTAQIQDAGRATLLNMQDEQCRRDPTLPCAQRGPGKPPQP